MAAEIAKITGNPLLSKFLFLYKYDGFIGKEAVPFAQVESRTFRVQTLNENPYRIPNALTGPRGKVQQVEIDAKQDQFTVEDYYLEEPVDRIEQGEAVTFDRKAAATEFIANTLDLIYEKQAADLLQTQSNYAAGFFSTPGILWSVPATAVPLTDIWLACETLLKWPTTIVFGQQSWSKFQTCDQVLKAFGISGGNTGAPSNVTTSMVADYFGVKQVLVGRVKYNSAIEGAADAFSFVWGKHCMVLSQEAQPKKDTVTHSFAASETQADTQEYFDKDPGPKGSDWVRAGRNYKLILKAQKYGYFLESVTA